VFYSSNGGTTWTDVEGNLAGENGPSVRWAAIVPSGGSKVYFLAASTGVYSTTALNGANTQWVQEGNTSIGNVVVDMIVARPEDELLVAGTANLSFNITATGPPENHGFTAHFI
jgi:hypothetical protein